MDKQITYCVLEWYGCSVKEMSEWFYNYSEEYKYYVKNKDIDTDETDNLWLFNFDFIPHFILMINKLIEQFKTNHDIILSLVNVSNLLMESYIQYMNESDHIDERIYQKAVNTTAH